MRCLFAAGGLALCLGLGATLSVGFAPTSVVARTMADTLRRTGLSQADINMLSQAGGGLYRSGTPKVGAEAEWSNPDTGASGTATLLRFADNCADVRHVVITTRRPEPQEFNLRNCKTADGSWILTP